MRADVGGFCPRTEGVAMDFAEKRYEGVNALSGLAFAVYEECGIADAVRSFAGASNRFVELAVKAAVGGMMLPFDRIPFGRYRELYASAPVDLVFGEGLELRSFHGMAFGRVLDALHGADLQGLIWRCARMCCDRYGLSSDIIHLDATNVSVYAIEDLSSGKGVSARYGGNSKTNRNDLPQYDAMAMTDGNRVIRYMRGYDGNTSDHTMNRDAVDFLRRSVDPEASTVVGDSKLASRDLIATLIDAGFAFVTKCPEGFSDRVRGDIAYSVRCGSMEPSGLGEGCGVYDTDAETVCGPLRFVAYRIPRSRSKSVKYYLEEGERRIVKTLLPLARRWFFCESDAERALAAALEALADTAYRVSGRVVRTPGPIAIGGRVLDEIWEVVVEYGFDEALAIRLADENDVQVLVTNIPRANETAERVRDGATADGVVRLYLDEYKAEHCYKMLKSGLGMDRVHLHKGARVAAMFGLCAIGGVISSVMDAVLRRGNSGHTVYRLRLRLSDTTVRVKRATGYTYIDGPPGIGSEVEELCRMLDVDPELMIARRP